MLALIDPYREPDRGRPRPRSRGRVELGLLASLVVLALWAALRIVCSVLQGHLDGEGAMAALLLVGVLHALARAWCLD